MQNRYFLFVLFALPICSASAQPALISWVNASPDSAHHSIDIWIDTLAVAENLGYMHASAQWPAANDTLAVAVMKANDTLLFDTIILESGQHYWAIFSGLRSPAYDTTGFGLRLRLVANTAPAANAGNAQLRVINTVADGGAFYASLGEPIEVTLAQAAPFAAVGNWYSAEALNTTLTVSASAVAREFYAPLGSLNLADSAVSFLVGGFANAAALGSANEMVAFWLSGTGALQALSLSTAQLRWVNNLVGSAQDFYVGPNLSAANKAFRTATDFTTVASGDTLVLATLLAGSAQMADSLASKAFVPQAGKRYVVQAVGAADTVAGVFAPRILVYEWPEAGVGPGAVAVSMVNAAVGWSVASLENESAQEVIPSVGFGMVGTPVLLSAAPAKVALVAPSGATALEYEPALNELGGQTVQWIVSGTADPSADSSLAIGLFALTPLAGPLIELPRATGFNQVKAAVPLLFPNPAKEWIEWAFESPLTELAIANCAGNWVKKWNSPAPQLFIGDLPAGLYAVRLSTAEGFVVKKLVIAPHDK